MQAENPNVISKPSITSNIAGVVFVALGCYGIYKLHDVSAWMGGLPVLIGIGFFYNAWNNTILVYDDRLVIRNRFDNRSKTIPLKDIHSTVEKPVSRAGPILNLHTRYEIFPINSDNLGNYDEIKNAIIKHVPNHHPIVPQDNSALLKGLLVVFLFVAAVIMLKLFLLAFD